MILYFHIHEMDAKMHQEIKNLSNPDDPILFHGFYESSRDIHHERVSQLLA